MAYALTQTCRLLIFLGLKSAWALGGGGPAVAQVWTASRHLEWPLSGHAGLAGACSGGVQCGCVVACLVRVWWCQSRHLVRLVGAEKIRRLCGAVGTRYRVGLDGGTGWRTAPDSRKQKYPRTQLIPVDADGGGKLEGRWCARELFGINRLTRFPPDVG